MHLYLPTRMNLALPFPCITRSTRHGTILRMIARLVLILQVVSSWQKHLQRMVDELERAVKQPTPLLALPGKASPLDSVPKLSQC